MLLLQNLSRTEEASADECVYLLYQIPQLRQHNDSAAIAVAKIGADMLIADVFVKRNRSLYTQSVSFTCG